MSLHALDREGLVDQVLDRWTTNAVVATPPGGRVLEISFFLSITLKRLMLLDEQILYKLIVLLVV